MKTNNAFNIPTASLEVLDFPRYHNGNNTPLMALDKLYRVPYNVKITDHTLVIEVYTPGFSKDSIQVNVDGQTLLIKGVKKQHQGDQFQKMVLMQWSERDWSLSLKISPKYDLGKLEARLVNGILVIEAPQHKDWKRTIDIK